MSKTSSELTSMQTSRAFGKKNIQVKITWILSERSHRFRLHRGHPCSRFDAGSGNQSEQTSAVSALDNRQCGDELACR